MQPESFYEESAVSSRARKEAKFYTAFHIVSIIFMVIAAITLFFSLSYIGTQKAAYDKGNMTKAAFVFSIVEWVLLLLSAVGISIGFYFFKRRYNMSFDYIFVEDELRVSKVFNGRKRKFVGKFEADHILKLGWASNDSFDRTAAGIPKKNIILLTPNKEPSEGKDFYYMYYSNSIGKYLYVLEARKELLECLVRAAGISKLERK